MSAIGMESRSVNESCFPRESERKCTEPAQIRDIQIRNSLVRMKCAATETCGPSLEVITRGQTAERRQFSLICMAFERVVASNSEDWKAQQAKEQDSQGERCDPI